MLDDIIGELDQVDVSSLKFLIYSNEEIEKLSHSLQITDPNTFDSAMNCNSFAMHDPRLGPQNFGEICETCGKDVNGCDGHYGFIKLPVPVFNPMFFNQLIMILRSICINCCRINIPKKILVKIIQKNFGKSFDPLLKDFTSENVDEINVNTDDTKNLSNMADITQNGIVEDSSTFEDYLKHHQSRRCINCSHPAVNISSRPGSVLVVKIRSMGQTALLGNSPTLKSKKISQHTYILNPLKTKNIIKMLWEKDNQFLTKIFPIFNNYTREHFENPYDIFFIDKLLVPPPKFRPLTTKATHIIQESPHTFLLNKILTDSIIISDFTRNSTNSAFQLINRSKNTQNEQTLSSDNKTFDSQNSYQSIQSWPPEKLNQLNHLWRTLQNHVNGIFDSDKDIMTSIGKVNGVKQVLEKKEGLLRMHMMGKRVNYAMRSVISPDPMLNVNEVGIPENLAKNITFPENITSKNLEYICKLIINGPDVHPGALMLETDTGIKRYIPRSLQSRQTIIRQLRKKLSEFIIIHRHLQNGDVLYMNRQPSLHKNSLQGHIVQVLPNQKTLRIHYSSCKSYNADFDGDEMNGHLCQSYLSKAEAQYLANVDNNFLVAKDGSPIAGLIQDHVIAGVYLSSPNMIFSSFDYFQLISEAFKQLNDDFLMIPPAIIANGIPYWTGMQIFSTVIRNIVSMFSETLPNVKYSTKIPSKEIDKSSDALFFDKNMCHSNVIICNGDVMCGYFDKASLGSSKFGIIHKCNELYGGSCSTKLLSSFSHLLTYLLRIRGFTLGIEDVLNISKSSKLRHDLVVNFDESYSKKNDNGMTTVVFDNNLKSIVSNTFDSGLLKKFPSNNLQLMIISGSKGTMLNSVQISQNVGQIQLEGKKIERSILGMTLPSFKKNDPNPRSTGFVADSFLSGLRPQDFFMHCMAGREGLVDTNVKTSRIGYLQRCLIKNLEGLIIHYDGTVRDLNNNKNIIQFLYGEDGIDPCKTSYLYSKNCDISTDYSKKLKNHDILKISRKKIENYMKIINMIKNKTNLSKRRQFEAFDNFCLQYTHPKLNKEDIKKNFTFYRPKRDASLCYEWSQLSEEEKQSYSSDAKYDFKNNLLNATYNCQNMLGCVSDKYLESLQVISNERHTNFSKKEFKNLMFKYMISLGQPGDNVGIICAQSIGEPSTQMTLNTFHLAGHGDVNVTLGVPRLKEIIMTAAKSISTPLIEIFLRSDLDYQDVAQAEYDLTEILTPRLLIDFIDSVGIIENDDITINHRSRIYTIDFTLNQEKINQSTFNNNYILRKIESLFIPKFCSVFNRKLKLFTNKINTMKGTLNIMNLLLRTEEISKMNVNVTNSADNSHNDSDTDIEDEDLKENIFAKEDDNNDEQLESDIILGDDCDDSCDSKIQQEEDKIVNEVIDGIEENNHDKVLLKDDITISSYKLKKANNINTLNGIMSREEMVICQSSLIDSYSYDKEKESSCSLSLKIPLDSSVSKFNFDSFFKDYIESFKISNKFPGCQKCIIQEKPDGTKAIMILGIPNIDPLITNNICQRSLDFSTSQMNSIADMISCFGIEVGYSSIISEIQKVFLSYGISIDVRHLSLLADHMTHDGTYSGLNRSGTIVRSKSPFHKMSFETCFEFLKQSVVSCKKEDLEGHSSRICMGQTIKSGTGMFDIFTEF